MITRRRFAAGLTAATIGVQARPSLAWLLRHGGATASVNISSVAYGSVYKYNSGYPTKYVSSDVWAATWADDNNIYVAHDDFIAADSTWTGGNSNMAVSQLSGYSTSLTGTIVNQLVNWGAAATGGSDGLNYKARGLASVNGTLYLVTSRQGITAPFYSSSNAQIIKSTNHGASWTPLPPATAQPYASPMFSGAVNSTCYFVQYGKDYVGQSVDRSSEFLYGVSNDGFWNNGSQLYLGRVLLTALPNLNGANWSYYQGGDGALDANWGSWGTATPIISNSLKISSNGVQYFPAFGRYVFINWYYPSVASGGGLDASITQWDFYQAPAPWGPWSLLSSVVWNTEPGQGLYNPVVIPKSLEIDGGKTAVIATAGDFFNTNNATGDYTLTLVPITLT